MRYLFRVHAARLLGIAEDAAKTGVMVDVGLYKAA